MQLATDLAVVARHAFEGKHVGDVWFRNARIEEIGVDGAWFQTNVTVDFMYDEIR